VVAHVCDTGAPGGARETGEPMTSADPKVPEGATPAERISTLRGAGVSVNARTLSRVIAALVLTTFAVLVVVFSVVGAHKNAQINELRQHGVRVEVTVTGCLGLLGGSGSNAAGYACNGTFTLAGHRYTENIPGNALRRPGSKLEAVTVRNDPQLLDLPAMVASEHASWRVYILPLVLLVVLVLAVAGLLVMRQRQRPESSDGVPKTSL